MSTTITLNSESTKLPEASVATALKLYTPTGSMPILVISPVAGSMLKLIVSFIEYVITSRSVALTS